MNLLIKKQETKIFHTRPYPHAGKFNVENESKKHAASLPKPPLPILYKSFNYRF